MTVLSETASHTCEACGSSLVERDGFLVCGSCGLVKERLMIPGLVNVPGGQYVYHDPALGSQISYGPHDAKGRILPDRTRAKLSILRSIQRRSRGKIDREERARILLWTICGRLALSNEVKHRAANILSSALRNWFFLVYAELVVVVVLAAIRERRLPITYAQVREASGLVLRRHRVNRARFHVNQICRIRYSRPEHFLARVISEVQSFPEIRDRAAERELDLDRHMIQLERVARELLSDRATRGRHPLQVAVSVLYAADRLTGRRLLTHDILGRATRTSVSTVSEQWKRFWRPILEAEQ